VGLAPVAVFSLLIGGPLIQFPVRTMGFGLPPVVNDGLVLCRFSLSRLGLSRLRVIAPIMVVISAAGGQNSGRQCGGKKAQGESFQKHRISFRAEG
jgi:hypothetical protein